MAKEFHVEERVRIPEGVEVSIEGSRVTVRGPRGTLSRDFSHARGVLLRLEGREVVVETFIANSRRRALVGTLAAHINNMILGVTRGFVYRLRVVFTHFPISVKVEDDRVSISNFLGEKSPRHAKILPGASVRVEGNEIVVEGIDLEAVSQTAANLELATRVTDRDRRKFIDGVYLYSKGVGEGG